MKGPQLQWPRFGRFTLVGVLGAAWQLLLISFFTKQCHLPAVIATALAVEAVLLHNFWWHGRFTWRDRPNKTRRRRILVLLRFHAGNGLVSLAGNTALAYWLVDRLKAPAMPSALASILICSLINFVLADRWVYATDCDAVPDPGGQVHW